MTLFTSLGRTISLLLLCLSGFAQHNNALSPGEFRSRLSDSIQLLDVRTSDEFKNGYIENAFHADWQERKEFARRVSHLDKTKSIYIYCASGGRSAAAAKYLRSHGFSQVHELDGGLIAWRKANLPLKAKAKVPELTEAEFQSLINSDEKVLLRVGTQWCPPCRAMEPVLKKFESENPAKLIRIDADTNPSLAKSLNIIEYPTFISYKNGKEAARLSGVQSLDELNKLID